MVNHLPNLKRSQLALQNSHLKAAKLKFSLKFWCHLLSLEALKSAVLFFAGGWLGHPSEKYYEFVNWDDDIPN